MCSRCSLHPLSLVPDCLAPGPGFGKRGSSAVTGNPRLAPGANSQDAERPRSGSGAGFQLCAGVGIQPHGAPTPAAGGGRRPR